MAEEPKEAVESEDEIVTAFVRDRLVLDLGFTLRQADLLVAAHADWHEVAAVIARGCPRELAFEIYV